MYGHTIYFIPAFHLPIYFVLVVYSTQLNWNGIWTRTRDYWLKVAISEVSSMLTTTTYSHWSADAELSSRSARSVENAWTGAWKSW